MKLTVFRIDSRYRGNGKHTAVAETLTFEIKDDTWNATIHFDPQTRVLRVTRGDQGGSVIAAVSRVDYFHVGDVIEFEKVSTEEPEWAL